MRTILGGRASGKTRQLLHWMAQAPEGEKRVFMTFSVAAADHARSEAKRLGFMKPDPVFCGCGKVCPHSGEPKGLEPWQFVSVRQRDQLLGRGNIRIGIDEAGLVLQNLLGREVGAMTVDATDVAMATPLTYYEV